MEGEEEEEEDDDDEGEQGERCRWIGVMMVTVSMIDVVRLTPSTISRCLVGLSFGQNQPG